MNLPIDEACEILYEAMQKIKKLNLSEGDKDELVNYIEELLYEDTFDHHREYQDREIESIKHQ